MKFQIFHTLCILCFLHTSAFREYDQWNDRSTVQDPSESFEKLPVEFSNTEKLRDKRALGLILSGLAQVFGYNVNPIQIATLPNPNSGQPLNADSGKSTNPTQQAPSSAAPNPSATAANQPATLLPNSTTVTVPRQRETIRFTGVVNFGNNTDVVSQLQQYERIFHGESTTRGPTTTLAPSTSSSASLTSQDLRTITDEKSPLLSPLLVRIPLPIVPELPRPELPNEDFQLSYPETYLPIRTEQETVYRKNENTEKLTVTGKDISKSEDVQSPIANNARDNNDRYNEESKWKKEYEDRLAELERKQMEHEEKLRQQDSYRHKGVGKEERVEERYRNREKVTVDNSKEKDLRYKEKDSGNYKDYSEEEKEDSREKYEDRKKTQEYTPSRFSSSEKQKDDGKKYPDYGNSYRPYKQYEESLPIVFSNYTGLQSNEQLPISDYYEQRKPDGLRNSYGEILDSHELNDEGIADYYEKFKKPQTGLYESSKSRGSGGSSREEKKVEGPGFQTKKEEEALERLRQEYSYPSAENKYEEYSLEEDKEEKDDKNSKIAEQPYHSAEVSKNVASYSSEQENAPRNVKYEKINANKDQSNSEENLSQEFDFLKYTPYIVPGRYLYAPEELERANLRFPASDKSSDTGSGEVKAKIATESKELESQPKVGLSKPIPQRLSSKTHHRIEQKELWPLPLDYTYDVPQETIAVPEKSQRLTDRKFSSAYQIPTVNRKEKESPQRRQRLRGRTNNFTPRYPEYPETTPYFRQNLESQKPRQKSRAKSRVSGAAVSSTPLPIIKTKTTAWGDRERAKETPSIIERYRYTSNDRYPNTEQPNVEILRSVQPEVPKLYLQPVEIAEQNNRETEPIVENYYSHVYPKENREKEVERARLQEARESSQKLIKADTFDSPKSAHNFFGFSRDDYSFDDGNVEKKGDEKSAIEEEAIGLIVPEPDPYVYDESLTKFTDEPESKNGRVKVREYANKVATVRVSAQRQANPSKPDKREEIQKRNELEHKMSEILDNLKTRLLVE